MREKVDMKPLVDYDGELTEEERRRILTRLNSMFAWAGAAVPEHIEADGERIPVKRTIDDLVMKEELDDADRRKIRALIRGLKRREKVIRKSIRDGDISEDKAVELYDEVRGILRAVSRIRRLQEDDDDGDDEPDADLEKKALMSRVDDERRWRRFLDRVR